MGELSDSYGKWLKSVPTEDVYIKEFIKQYRSAIAYFPEIINRLESAAYQGRRYAMPLTDYKLVIEKFEEIQQLEILETKRSKILQAAAIYEKVKSYDEAISLYLQAIELAKVYGKNNLAYFSYHIQKVLVLYSKTKQIEKEKELLEECISNYPESGEVYKWNERLSRILGKKDSKISNSISKGEIVINSPTGETLGNQLFNLRKEDPEFNFYFDKPDEVSTLEYFAIHVKKHMIKAEKLRKVRSILDKVNNLLLEGKSQENLGKFALAIQIYEELLLENLNNTKPYEKLIAIYKKLKWAEDEIRILKSGIEYFTNLRANQLEYVLGLADKYGKREFAEEYISQGKKIFHFMGGYELYNPYPIIEKWQVRLKQLTDKLK